MQEGDSKILLRHDDSRLLRYGMINGGAKEHRRRNLLALLANKAKFKSDLDFAKQAGVAAPQISQVKNGTRAMGDTIARRIEQNLGLSSGWMDVDHTYQSTGLKIAEHWDDVPETVRRAIWHCLNTMLEGQLDRRKNKIGPPPSGERRCYC